MVGAKVDEVELLCSPRSVAFSAADNLLTSDVAIVLVVAKASGLRNYWANTNPNILSNTDVPQPYDQPRGV